MSADAGAVKWKTVLADHGEHLLEGEVLEPGPAQILVPPILVVPALGIDAHFQRLFQCFNRLKCCPQTRARHGGTTYAYVQGRPTGSERRDQNNGCLFRIESSQPRHSKTIVRRASLRSVRMTVVDSDAGIRVDPTPITGIRNSGRCCCQL
ncbi:MAG: hypothetical protein QHC88_12100 [Achromobacter sp.]|uniref:hypothetical protein n=1 Tax=Achromobacter sp. TaxID=134375 RepID=UPI0029A4B8AC|nr:hypothetical protein [Achromobacter sp.]MDX3985984.1 hypothetical protein [Achromobacter sp.]